MICSAIVCHQPVPSYLNLPCNCFFILTSFSPCIFLYRRSRAVSSEEESDDLPVLGSSFELYLSSAEQHAVDQVMPEPAVEEPAAGSPDAVAGPSGLASASKK